ncbi:MAG TPA: hypothetical protein VIZ00_01290 [Streptosporangiaceae bacterium]
MIVEGMGGGEEHDPRRRTAAEPPPYGVDGWVGQREVSAAGLPGRGGDVALVSVSVVHRHLDASITVTSHRQQDSDMVVLRRRLSQGTGQGELTWTVATIPVDGRPAAFQLCEVREGRWVAAGRTGETGLTLDSRGVPLAGLALAQVTDLPVPEPRLRQERPAPPAREFPADSGPAGSLPRHARVDLTYDRFRLLTGSVGELPVRLDLNVPTHRGAAAGTIAGIPVSAAWENGDNYYLYPDVPSDLTGSFAGQPAELHATFHLEPGYFFDRGTITGHVGADALEATVEAAATGGLGGTPTVAVDGTLGTTAFTIFAAIDGGRASGKIRGTVDGTSIRIDASRTRRPDGESIRLTGSYQGPPALLALTAGALLHFI